MVLRHPQHGAARVAIRRNSGAPLGVAHTDHLDLLLMNGGSGTSETEPSVGTSARSGSQTAAKQGRQPDPDVLAALRPHSETRSAAVGRVRADTAAAPDTSGRVAPHIDLDAHTISFEFDETGVSRLPALRRRPRLCRSLLRRLDAGRRVPHRRAS